MTGFEVKHGSKMIITVEGAEGTQMPKWKIEKKKKTMGFYVQ